MPFLFSETMANSSPASIVFYNITKKAEFMTEGKKNVHQIQETKTITNAERSSQ